jgi:hypothetical protein
MFDLPIDLIDLDIIYFSWGVICWAPDLNEFARVIAERLRRGGVLLMADHHPVWEVLAVRGDNHLAVAGDYFGRGRRTPDQDDAKRPVGSRGEAGAPSFSAFVWPTSDVVMAFVKPVCAWTPISKHRSPPSIPASAPSLPPCPPTTSSRRPNSE